MPTGLKRYQQSGQFHFVTFSCFHRKPLLASTEAKNIVERILEHTRAQQELALFAYVLMPEHVHLLSDEPSRDTLATFLQILKQRSSHMLRGSRQEPFWQCRYYDRNVRTHGETIGKIGYIYRNPVKRNLVSHPEEYAWSSARRYATGTPGTVHVHRTG